MTIFEIPILTTDRLRLRAFKASDLDAYAAMQANPEVMRYLVTGRTSTPVEVWRTMATSVGAWALRGYGMWACEKIDDGATGPSGDRVSRLKRRRRLATGCSSTFRCLGLRASSDRTIMHRSASRNGSARSANAHSSCVALSMNIGCITAPEETRNCPGTPPRSG